MSVREFTLGNLRLLDGGQVQRAFDAAVQRAVRDCSDRPTEDRVRKVTIQVEVKPGPNAGTADDVELLVQVQEKIPAMSSRPVLMQIRKRGGQLMLAFDDEGEGEE